MRRTVLALILALLASAALTLSALAQAGPTIRSSPDTGNQFQDFTFRGDGFPAGTRLAITFTDPAGASFSLQINGKPAVWVVDPAGAFEFQIVPAVDLKGAQAGTWAGRMCVEGTETCWSGQFTITLS